MNELTQFVMGLSGPLPHMCLFGTIGMALGWWTNEFRATFTIMIVMSIGGECLQLRWPHIYDFDLMDIVWNISGSAIGILIAHVGHFLSSELWFRREKDWNILKGEMRHGNYS